MQKPALKQLEALERRYRSLSRTGLTGEPAQSLELFLKSMENASGLIKLSRQLVENVEKTEQQHLTPLGGKQYGRQAQV